MSSLGDWSLAGGPANDEPFYHTGTCRPPAEFSSERHYQSPLQTPRNFDDLIARDQKSTPCRKSGEHKRFAGDFAPTIKSKGSLPGYGKTEARVYSPDRTALTMNTPAAIEAVQYLADFVHKYRTSPTAA
mgnify:CR=1 FL=1